MLTLLWIVSANAVEPIALAQPDAVEIVQQMALPSLDELALERSALGCRVIVSTSREVPDEEVILPNRRCPKPLFDAIQAHKSELELSWSSPTRADDVVVQLQPVLDAPSDEPLTFMVAPYAYDGTFKPEVRFVGKARKSPDGVACSVDVRVHKSGDLLKPEVSSCPKGFDRGFLIALEGWRLDIPSEVVPRAMYARLTLHHLPEVELWDGTEDRTVLAWAAPKVVEREDIEWPEEEEAPEADGESEDTADDAVQGEDADGEGTTSGTDADGETAEGGDVPETLEPEPDEAEDAEEGADAPGEEAETAEDEAEDDKESKPEAKICEVALPFDEKGSPRTATISGCDEDKYGEAIRTALMKWRILPTFDGEAFLPGVLSLVFEIGKQPR
jgi:hypothetical protein